MSREAIMFLCRGVQKFEVCFDSHNYLYNLNSLPRISSQIQLSLSLSLFHILLSLDYDDASISSKN